MTKRILVFLVFISVLVTLYVLLREHLTWDALIAEERELRAALDRDPLLGFGLGFLLYVGISLIPGTTGKAIIAGWLYGFWAGLILVNFGLTLAAMLSFWVSRYAFHDYVASRLGARLSRVNEALEREGASYLFAGRVLHIPFCLTNYVMGSTRIRATGFWWATQLGILPGNMVFVYAGSQAPTLAELHEQGLMALLSPGLVLAFLAMSILPFLLRTFVRRFLAAARARRSARSESRIEPRSPDDHDPG